MMPEKTDANKQVHERTSEQETASPDGATAQRQLSFSGDGLTPNQRAVLRMQQTQGNAAVRRVLSRSRTIVQRTTLDEMLTQFADWVESTELTRLGISELQTTAETLASLPRQWSRWSNLPAARRQQFAATASLVAQLLNRRHQEAAANAEWLAQQPQASQGRPGEGVPYVSPQQQAATLNHIRNLGPFGSLTLAIRVTFYNETLEEGLTRADVADGVATIGLTVAGGIRAMGATSRMDRGASPDLPPARVVSIDPVPTTLNVGSVPTGSSQPFGRAGFATGSPGARTPSLPAGAQVITPGTSGAGHTLPTVRSGGPPSSTSSTTQGRVREPSAVPAITLEYAPDLTRPLSSAGDNGSAARTAGLGRGAYLSHYTENGTRNEVVVKVPANRIFQQELDGALAAEATGFGPRVFGTATVNGNRAIVMGRQPGGFISTTSHNNSHIQEAEHFSGRVTENTITELNQYRDRLLQSNHISGGDLQYFVDDLGHFRPIDFQAIEPLSRNPQVSQEQRRNHLQEFAHEEQILRGRLNENMRRGNNAQ